MSHFRKYAPGTPYEDIITGLEDRIDLLESVILSDEKLRSEYEQLLVIKKLKGETNG